MSSLLSMLSLCFWNVTWCKRCSACWGWSDKPWCWWKCELEFGSILWHGRCGVFRSILHTQPSCDCLSVWQKDVFNSRAGNDFLPERNHLRPCGLDAVSAGIRYKFKTSNCAFYLKKIAAKSSTMYMECILDMLFQQHSMLSMVLNQKSSMVHSWILW